MTNVLTKTITNAPSGTYLVFWCLDYQMSTNWKEPEFEVRVNGSVKDDFKPEQRDDRWYPASKHFEVTHVSGDLTVSIHMGNADNGSVGCRRTRLTIFKVGE